MNYKKTLGRFSSGCLAVAILVSSPVWADDASKLKELERAMTAPSEKSVHKPRTRAIVFDEAPQADADTGPAKAPAQTQAAAGGCGMPAADAKITAVDFAIRFKIGSADLTEQSQQTLLQIAKILSISNNCVVVEGHTDSVGNADRNLELSRQRADSVVKFIAEKAGVDQARLVPVGKGSSEPIKNLNSRNPKNRRVVFKVVG